MGAFIRKHNFPYQNNTQRAVYNNSGNSSNYNNQQRENGRFTNQPDYNQRNTSANRKPSYYYDHCKINRHSTERGFKINGFPPNWDHNKGKRVANRAQTDTMTAEGYSRKTLQNGNSTQQQSTMSSTSIC